MEKGSLHLYLVARTDILESEEITVAHDTKNPLPCPYEGCPHMKNKDSGARTGLAPSAPTATAPPPPPPQVLSPVDIDRKQRRRRRTNSMATADASSSLNTTTTATTTTTTNTSSAVGPSESPSTTPSATSVQPSQALASNSVPSTPPALPPTPVKRQSRTPSKVSVVVTEGEDSQDDSLLPDEADGSGSLDNESSSNKKKLV